MKKAINTFLIFCFCCIGASAQVQPDPRVLVKQAGATTGQVLKWDGAKWVPDTDIGADGNGIYSGSGTSPANTVVTQAGALSIKNVNTHDFKVGDTDNATVGDGLLVTPTSVSLGNIFGSSNIYMISGQGVSGNYIRTDASNLQQGTANTVWNILAGNFRFTDSRATKVGLEYQGDYSSNVLGNARSIPDIGTVKSIYTAGTGISLTPSGNNIVIANTSTDNNGIYTGSGTVPNNTTATLTDDFTFSGVDNTGTQSPKFRVTATGTDPGVQVWKVGNDSLQLSFLSGEPTLEYAGQSGNDFWIKTGVHDLRIAGASFHTYPTKNIFGGYVATPYVQVAANTTINENVQNVDVLGATGSVTLTFDNTTNLLGTYSKTITVRNRGAHNVVLSRGSQSWEWSDFTGANTSSNQTLLPGETGTMFWEDAGGTDYYVLHKLPATFGAGGSGDILNGGNTTGAAITIGTNDGNALNFETNNTIRETIATSGSVTNEFTAATANAVNTAFTSNAYNGSVVAGFGMKHVYRLSTDLGGLPFAKEDQVYWTLADEGGVGYTSESKIRLQNFSTLTDHTKFTWNATDPVISFGAGTTTFGNSNIIAGNAFTLTATSNPLYIGTGSGLVNIYSTGTGGSIVLDPDNANGWVDIATSSPSTITSGAKYNMRFPQGFSASSGTGNFDNVLLSGTINQSGSATGEVNGIHVNHNITSAINYRGVHVESNGGTDSKAFYQDGSSMTNNFVGKTFFGATTSPTAMLHLGAGTTTLASLKFTSGSNLTTPEAGAVGWDGSRMYLTQSTGPTVKTVAYTDDLGGQTIISPSQLTAAADNWNPTDIATATIVRLSGDNQFRIISGITAPAASKELTLTNVGTFAVLISREDAASSAANRFAIDTDIPLYPGHSIVLWYDVTSTRWRLKSKTFSDSSVPEKQLGAYFRSAGSTTNGDYDHFLFAGSTLGVIPTSTRQRTTTVSTGAASNGLGSVTTKGAAIFAGTTSNVPNSISFKTVVSVNNLSDAGQTFTAECGWSVSTAIPSDGASFRYSHGVNGGKWLCVTRLSSAETTTDSGVTVAADTPDLLEIYHRPDNSVAFFINGAFVAEHTTNIFSSTATPSCVILKSVGTTARLLAVDLIQFYESRR